jgi:hypothetical protein
VRVARVVLCDAWQGKGCLAVIGGMAQSAGCKPVPWSPGVLSGCWLAHVQGLDSRAPGVLSGCGLAQV